MGLGQGEDEAGGEGDKRGAWGAQDSCGEGSCFVCGVISLHNTHLAACCSRLLRTAAGHSRRARRKRQQLTQRPRTVPPRAEQSARASLCQPVSLPQQCLVWLQLNSSIPSAAVLAAASSQRVEACATSTAVFVCVVLLCCCRCRCVSLILVCTMYLPPASYTPSPPSAGQKPQFE